MRRALAGDPEARQKVIQSHLRLVWAIVHRFTGRGVDEEDLFQLGCLGLLKALDRYDPSYGTRFSTYAVPLVLGEIRRFLRHEGPLRVSRETRERARRALRVQEELTQASGRTPSVAEVAEVMGVDPAEVAEALEACRPPLSLYQEAGEEGEEGVYLIDRLAARDDAVAAAAGRPGRGTPPEGPGLDAVALREAMSRLDERTRLLLHLRFFEDRTQAQVGEALGVSQVQVSRLEKQALMRLREMLSP
ncbi:MAG: SigB/SigF/SigG family RNA polymerase sigma factor [Firmicutes bacterium]|nr:SigB/SigF/SigG family RNA polymerase sigma factor [Bacillota bacterium]